MKVIDSQSGSEFTFNPTNTLVARRIQKEKFLYFMYSNRLFTSMECASVMNCAKNTFVKRYNDYMKGVSGDEKE